VLLDGGDAATRRLDGGGGARVLGDGTRSSVAARALCEGKGVRLRTSAALGSNENGPEKGVEGREKKEKGFSDFEKQQTNDFKHKFEFKHSKTMHQHVCNIKLL
jgi:hypothetical protein